MKSKDVYDKLANEVFETSEHLFKLTLGFRYPKLLLLLASTGLAYYAFASGLDAQIAVGINGDSLPTAFISGLLYSFGFTAPFAVGFFISLNVGANAAAVALIGGLGSAIADLTIFRIIKTGFSDEFEKLKKTREVRNVSVKINESVHGRIKQYVLVALAGIVIASPLPDEIGVSFLSGFTNLDERKLALLSFVLNTAGIWLLLQL